MKLVKIQEELINRFAQDAQFMQKKDRPCVLIVKLKYKGRLRSFAVPFRSNIHPSTPKNEYFAFPPRPTTRPLHRHGLHYAKMFPVENKYFEYFRTSSDYYKMMLDIIDKNEKTIVEECQAYLERYERGEIPHFATDIDFLLKLLVGDQIKTAV